MSLFSMLALTGLGILFIYLVWHGPASTLVCRDSSADNIIKYRDVLEKNGIRTFAKNIVPEAANRLFKGRSWPSLHVIDADEREKAIGILRELLKSNVE